MIAQRTEEWFQARKFRLTGSDFAAAMGISPYKSRQALWREKTGREAPFQGNEMTLWGETHEPDAINAYEIETGNLVLPSGLIVHPVHDWLAVSPDGIVPDRGSVECKSPFSCKPHEEVPEHYRPQCIGVAGTSGADWCDFVSWTPEETRIWRVAFSEEYWEWMFPLLKDFWSYVESDIEPKRQKKPVFAGKLKIERLK